MQRLSRLDGSHDRSSVVRDADRRSGLHVAIRVLALLTVVALFTLLPRHVATALIEAYNPELNSAVSPAGVGRILCLSVPFALITLVDRLCWHWFHPPVLPWRGWLGDGWFGGARGVLVLIVLSAATLLYAARSAPQGSQVLLVCLMIGVWLGSFIAWLITRLA